jgi:aminoglycoside phosphotransferase
MDFIKHAKMLFKKHFNEERELILLKQNNINVLTDDHLKSYIVKYVDETSLHVLRFETKMSAFLSEKMMIALPKVIEIDTYLGYAYMLREMVIGKPLSNILNNKDNHQSLIEASGQVLALVHQNTFEDKGFINEHLEVEKANIFSQEEFDTLLSIFSKKQIFNNDEMLFLKSLQIDHLFSIKPYVLCHADYHPNHIIVDKNKIVSIIDLEWMCSAPPFDDLATFHIFLKFLNQNQYIKDFYNGYQKVKSIDSHYFKSVDQYILYRLMTMVGYQLSLDQIEMQDFFIQALNELKSHLSKMMQA